MARKKQFRIADLGYEMWDGRFMTAERYKVHGARHKAQEISLGSQAYLAPKGHFATEIVNCLLPAVRCQLYFLMLTPTDHLLLDSL